MSSEHESSGISADVPRPPSAPPPASPVVSALSAALSACALSLPLSLAYQCLSLVLRLRKSSSSSNSARVQGRRDSRREALVLGTLSQANQHALQLAASLAVFQAAYRFLLQCPPLPTVAAAPRHAPRASSSQAPLHHSEQERPRAQDAFLAALIASPLALEALVPSRRLSSGKSGGRGGQGLQATLASYALLRALHALGVALRESIRERGATATAADDDDGETEKAKRSNSDGGGAWRAIAVKLMSSSMWLPSLSNAVLLHACVFHPSTFPRAYSSLIFRYSRPYLRLGAHHHQHRGAARPLPPGEIFETLAQTARARTPAPADAHALAAISSSRSREVLAEILQSQGSAITPARAPAYLTCAILHHAQEPSCTLQAIKYIAWATRQSLPFFGAFSLLGALVAYARAAARTRRKASQQGAGEVTSEKRTLNAWRLWRSALRSTALSSLTLAMALGTAWSSVCAIQRLLPSREFAQTA